MAESPLAHSPTLAAGPVGERIAASPRLAKDTAVGEYLVDRFLGAGAMGEVYAGHHPVIRKKVAMLFQGGALFDSMSVQDNIAYGLREHTDLGEGSIREVVRQKLALVGLEGVEDVMPSELSAYFSIE